MQKNKYGLIKYRTGYKRDEAQNIEIPCYSTKKFVINSVKRYGNCLHKLSKLEKCSYLFLEYLTEEMDSTNTVHITKIVRQRFLQHLSKNCDIQYKDETVKKAIRSLNENSLLINYGGRVDYTVNPLYFFAGSEKDRSKLISKLLHESCKPAEKGNIKNAMGIASA